MANLFINPDKPFYTILIQKEHSFYSSMKNIILQSDLLMDRMFHELGKTKGTRNNTFQDGMCNNLYFVNADFINPNDESDFIIGYQERTSEISISTVPKALNASEFTLTYHRDLFNNTIENEIVVWWESIKENVKGKYGKLDNAPEIWQFARQCRNACGHNGVNIRQDLKCPEPLWKGTNLKSFAGKRLRTILTEADIFDFWIDFEKEEMNASFIITRNN